MSLTLSSFLSIYYRIQFDFAIVGYIKKSWVGKKKNMHEVVMAKEAEIDCLKKEVALLKNNIREDIRVGRDEARCHSERNFQVKRKSE